jgi:hypothetical protein
LTDFLRGIWATAIALPVVVATSGLAVGAAIGVSWSKSEVIPVVLVKPGIGGFEPVDGSSIGNMWPKSEVKAVLLVKPGIGGFEPREGNSIGNYWSKDGVLPVMLVEPSTGAFVPLQSLSGSSGSYPSPAVPPDKEPSRAASTTAPPSPSVIESQIDGDFDGWEGETIIKLTNGQIWQQSEYFYFYHYAFMPKVLIFRSGYGFKMKVDGVDKPVGVTRLR